MERGLTGPMSLRDLAPEPQGRHRGGPAEDPVEDGISVISSYRGGYNFEAVGLSRAMAAEFFPGMPSRISGIGLAGLEQKALEIHRKAWGQSVVALPVGGFYKARRTGEAPRLRGAADPHAAARLRYGLLRQLQALLRRHARPGPGAAARTARLALGPFARLAGRGREHQRDPQALRHPRHVAGRAGPRGPRHAEHRHEPHRGQVGLRRRRRGPRALPAAAPTATTPTRPSSRWPRAASA